MMHARMGVFLRTGFVAASLCHMWRDFFVSLNEVLLTPETLQLITSINERRVKGVHCQKTELLNTTGKAYKIFECFFEMSLGIIHYFSACCDM
jgi:hypothetical protein